MAFLFRSVKSNCCFMDRLIRKRLANLKAHAYYKPQWPCLNIPDEPKPQDDENENKQQATKKIKVERNKKETPAASKQASKVIGSASLATEKKDQAGGRDASVVESYHKMRVVTMSSNIATELAQKDQYDLYRNSSISAGWHAVIVEAPPTDEGADVQVEPTSCSVSTPRQSYRAMDL